MNPRIKNVFPLEDYQLQLIFTNGEEGVFDVKPWLNKGVFKALKNEDLFKKAYVLFGSVSWNDDIDFSPDTLYLESKKLIVK